GLYGFTVLVVGMSLTLGNRSQRALRERDALLRELESRVEARTRALNEAYLEMEKRALSDSLTQVMNRRAVRERGTSELARARRPAPRSRYRRLTSARSRRSTTRTATPQAARC